MKDSEVMATPSATEKPVEIWILDDDESMCSLFARQCQKIGWQLHSYHHPKSFLLACQSAVPDVMVLDQLLQIGRAHV